MTRLHPDFLRLPVAHRGLHGPGVPENSMAAIRAAVAAGYAIEFDIQPAAGGEPMVFHDYDLSRMAGDEGFIADMTVEELSHLRLGGTDQAIPSLAAVLAEVAGRVPLLIEMKDQDGRMGGNVGDLPARVAAVLAGYTGPVAVMSFNPHMMAAFVKVAPDRAAGLTTCGYDAEEWPMLDDGRRAELAAIADFDTLGLDFISHDKSDLNNPAVTALKDRGVPVLCWTIRSADEERAARKVADNITFERYTPGAVA